MEVAILGAGIGGLSAAVSLRQAGHYVKVFEKSAFASEIGAAIAIGPNGQRVLSRLGFSLSRARACPLQSWEVVDGLNLKRLSIVDFSNASEIWAGECVAVHRVDFHKELLRLALETGPHVDGGTLGEYSLNAVELHLSSEVASVDSENGIVRFSDRSEVKADLIVGADGLHSVARRAILDEALCRPDRTELSSFRLLIPTARVADQYHLRKLMAWKIQGSTILADTSEKQKERHMVWYNCQDGEIQNIAGIHPTRVCQETESDMKAALLDEFRHFDTDVIRLLELADDVKRWNLDYYEPFPTWTCNRLVLVGDAAHPMLPFGGQAANQALEDAAALGYFLRGVNDKSRIPEMLRLFERVRKNRVSMIQILSSTRVGQENTVEQKLWQFSEQGATKVPTTFQERIDDAYGYDIFRACEAALQELDKEKIGEANVRA